MLYRRNSGLHHHIDQSKVLLAFDLGGSDPDGLDPALLEHGVGTGRNRACWCWLLLMTIQILVLTKVYTLWYGPLLICR